MSYLMQNSGGIYVSNGYVLGLPDKFNQSTTAKATGLNTGCVKFDPVASNNRYFIGDQSGSTMRVYNSTTGVLTSTITGLGGSSQYGIAFDVANNKMYIVGSSGKITVLNYTTLAVITTATIPVTANSINSFDLDTVNGKLWLPSYYDSKIYVVDVTTLTIVSSISSTNTNGPGAIAIDYAGNRVVMGSYQLSKLITYDRLTYAQITVFGTTHAFNSLSFDPVTANNRLIAGMGQNLVGFFDATTLGLLGTALGGTTTTGDIFCDIDPSSANNRILSINVRDNNLYEVKPVYS